MTTAPIDAVLLAFVVASAVAAALLRGVLAAIMAFSAFSIGVAIVWLVLGAPDVGLTEAAVGAGVTTILFVLTLARTVRPPRETLLERVDWRALAVAAGLVAVLATTLDALPATGDPTAPAASYRVTQYYLANAYEETGVRNVVTAILASYRGFDTLGEAVVVFTAAVGLLVVLGREVEA